MDEQDHDDQGKRLLERIQAHRGYTMPMHRLLAARHPDFLEGYDRLFTSAMSEDSPLEANVRELMVMALDLAVGTKPEVVRGHAQKAIALGATEEQVLAAIELTTIVFAGKALGAVAAVFDE
jgi:alkylhydroperoxidase/carboxymuconolactone decarboxylase family protein YurZ